VVCGGWWGALPAGRDLAWCVCGRVFDFVVRRGFGLSTRVMVLIARDMKLIPANAPFAETLLDGGCGHVSYV